MMLSVFMLSRICFVVVVVTVVVVVVTVDDVLCLCSAS